MNIGNLRVEYLPPSVLRLAEYNPRTHSKEQAEQLKESLKSFGFVDPVICNKAVGRENVTIGGHFRVKMAKELGIEKVPVVFVDIPNIDKEKELNLRLNKNTGEWDFEKLQSFNLDLLTDIGFDKNELLDFWHKDAEVKDEDFDEKEELKKIITPVTKLGDIIQLGNHRLICGDSTDPEVLKKLFGAEKASMIFSDPVYNIKINYNRGLGGKQNYGGNVIDNRTDEEYKEFLKKSMEAALTVTNENLHIIYWCDESYIWLLQTLYRELGIQNKRVCLWIKNGQNPTPQIAFNKCFEPCIYGIKGSPFLSNKHQDLNEVMNIDSGNGNELLDNINIWTEKRLSSKNYEHATSKPPKLYEKAIRRCTRPDDIILDSFAGSGSTLIASEQLKRRCFAVELEPVFCDLIIRRFEKLTGLKAKVM